MGMTVETALMLEPEQTEMTKTTILIRNNVNQQNHLAHAVSVIAVI